MSKIMFLLLLAFLNKAAKMSPIRTVFCIGFYLIEHDKCFVWIMVLEASLWFYVFRNKKSCLDNYFCKSFLKTIT